MEQIKEQYGSACNLLEMKTEDFYKLKGFLEGLGVQVRKCSEYAGTCVIQGRNCWKETAFAQVKTWDEYKRMNESVQKVIADNIYYK